MNRDKDVLRNMLIKDKLFNVLWISIAWLLISFYQYFDRYAILLEYNAIDENYDQWGLIRGILISLSLSVLFGVTALVFIWDRWLRKMTFIRAMFYIMVWYVALYTLLTFIAILLNKPPDLSQSDPRFYERRLHLKIANTKIHLVGTKLRIHQT